MNGNELRNHALDDAMIVHDADLSRNATDSRQRRLRAPATEMWDRMWDRLASRSPSISNLLGERHLLGARMRQRTSLCRRDFHSGAFERGRGGVNLGAKPLVFQHEPLLFLLDRRHLGPTWTSLSFLIEQVKDALVVLNHPLRYVAPLRRMQGIIFRGADKLPEWGAESAHSNRGAFLQSHQYRRRDICRIERFRICQ
jgi:hypothetical protein